LSQDLTRRARFGGCENGTVSRESCKGPHVTEGESMDGGGRVMIKKVFPAETIKKGERCCELSKKMLGRGEKRHFPGKMQLKKKIEI